MADGLSVSGGRHLTSRELQETIEELKNQLNAVIAQHGPRHAEVQSIMDLLDPLIAELMRRRLLEGKN